MNIAVVGGGINGLCCAWQLAIAGHKVTLFESDTLMSKTSIASSKLLHGGLRYLEHFEFRLVKEALQERQWWLANVPMLTRRLPIIYPIYSYSRPRWKLKLGLMLYDFLAGKKGIGRHRWLTRKQIKRCTPQLTQDNLIGGYLFSDGQMDDQALGLWVAQQCKKHQVKILEHTNVLSFDLNANLQTNHENFQFDHIVNAAGPWSAQLLEQSQIELQQSLDLVRGSHLILPPVSHFGHMLEVPGEDRVVFALPFKKQTLLGTTEVQQSLEEKVQVSIAERNYLIQVYNHYFEHSINESDIIQEFAGLRPLLQSENQLTKASREYKIIQSQKLTSIFGGKWTTARALAIAVANRFK